MRNIIIVVAIALIVGGASITCAQSDSVVTSETAPVVVEVGNKICPVSGEEVGEMGEVVKYEYNGKAYNLCCPACKEKFAQDAEKFAKIAEDEAAAPAAAVVDAPVAE